MDNLDKFKGKRHTLTHDDRVKGGKNMSPYRRAVMTMHWRQFCNPHCKIYPCIFEPLSRTKYNKRCALKLQEPRLLKRFYHIMSCGEDEFINEMSEALFKISLSDNPERLIQFGEKIFKMRFGDKSRVETRLNPYDEVVESLKIEPEKLKKDSTETIK